MRTSVLLAVSGAGMCTPARAVQPSLEWEEVRYQINGGEPILAQNEQIVEVQIGDFFAIVQVRFSSQGDPHNDDVASAEGFLRTDPTQPENFPGNTFRGSDPNVPVAVIEGIQDLGDILYDASGDLTPGWAMEAGTDRLALALIHNYAADPTTGCVGGQGDPATGCFEVDDRFFLNLQVGQPDFEIDDCAIQLTQGDEPDPTNPSPLLALDQDVQIFATIANRGGGLYYVDAECDIFEPGDGQPAWVGVASFLIGAGETKTIEIVNANPDDEFAVRWRPGSTGTYLVTITVDPEMAVRETAETNNFAIVGSESKRPRFHGLVTDFSELVQRLEDFELDSEIRDSSTVLLLCGMAEVDFDGLPHSFASRGIAPATCTEGFDNAYGAFRSLVAFGRIFAFDGATEILEDVVAEDYEAASQKLGVLEALLTECEDAIGDEVVVDSWNTLGDAFPFNVEQEFLFRRGTTGNVASILQAFLAYQVASGDDQFQEFAVSRLQNLLDGRLITEESPAQGMIASRPSGNGHGFVILENNLRALDMLSLAVMATSDSVELRETLEGYRDALEMALQQILTTGQPEDIPEAIPRSAGTLDNCFTAQDIYTIGGVFLLRWGFYERAWEFVEFVEDNFIVGQTIGSSVGRNLDPSGELPDRKDLAGLKFFDGCDSDTVDVCDPDTLECNLEDACSLLTSDVGDCQPPIDFDEPSIISIQTEATLDYILFLDELAALAPSSEMTEFAASRRDQLIEEVIKLFNIRSQKGGLPVSSRSIPNLFETFDGSLPSAEARIIAKVMADRSRLLFYRGVPSGN